jgi:Mannan-binding protein
MIWYSEMEMLKTLKIAFAALLVGMFVVTSHAVPALAQNGIDVKAGPIWDGTDAESKCPRVCARNGGVWNGQWRTTVWGSMSVCNCQGIVKRTKSRWKRCAIENETCSVPYPTAVRYGAQGRFETRQVREAVPCANAVFGDPIFGVVKTCSYRLRADMTAEESESASGDVLPETPPEANRWVACAREDRICSLPYRARIRYGAKNTFKTRVMSGRVACNNATFGDPLPGVRKSCAYLAQN